MHSAARRRYLGLTCFLDMRMTPNLEGIPFLITLAAPSAREGIAAFRPLGLLPASATVAKVAAAKTHAASNVVVAVIVVVVEELCRVEDVEVFNVRGCVLLRDLGGGRGCWPLSSIAPVRVDKVD